MFKTNNSKYWVFFSVLYFLKSQNLKESLFAVLESGKGIKGDMAWPEKLTIASPGFSILKTFDSPELFLRL